MRDIAVAFDNVSKSYKLNNPVTAGIKNFIINFRHVIRTIKDNSFHVLKNVSFEVYRGETFGIIGRNGAGKSTILGLIAKVLWPDEGNIIVNGKVSPLLELGAGFHPDLTGRENIILNGLLLGLTKHKIQEKMQNIIDFAELGEFIDQPIRIYSSGMLARLGFSIVITLDPEILLVDEILAVGDIAFQKKCISEIMKFKKEKVTMIIVSHSMSDIQRLCDRVMWIENGTVKMIDNPDKVIPNYINWNSESQEKVSIV